ncbi:10176_t:CDS:2 [Diversispora eburnea]|uniref:10176_t:CDS:1 n=1 Tax=Diversispora eburnea TaxID=1213867 RepID=A0A9N9A412_9GLOM|nr:10176_t:CDS:2 [Diversispora eburnea]
MFLSIRSTRSSPIKSKNKLRDYSRVGSFTTASSTTVTACFTTAAISVDVIPKRMPEFRKLWWDKGEFSLLANGKKLRKLPCELAVGVTLEEYERHSEKFNVRGCWEWINGKVIIYELPSEPYEVYIGTITRMLSNQTNAGPMPMILQKRPTIHSTYPNGIDGGTRPWPNLIIEVAYSESTDTR